MTKGYLLNAIWVKFNLIDFRLLLRRFEQGFECVRPKIRNADVTSQSFGLQSLHLGPSLFESEAVGLKEWSMYEIQVDVAVSPYA